MKLDPSQLEAAAYIFEKAHGNIKTAYEEGVIEAAGLVNMSPAQIEHSIVHSLNCNAFSENAVRIQAYWALSKSGNTDLIPHFTNWLKMELERDNLSPIYQIMIALQNLDEAVFHPERTGSSSHEINLNIRDARNYLKSKD